MERSSQLMLLATCLYALSYVEYTPAFMTPIQTSPQTGSLRGTATGATQEGPAGTYSMSTSLRTAAALVAVSGACMSCRGTRSKAGSPIARKAEGEGDEEGVQDYSIAQMLYETAMKKKEAVPVAQDMMRIRDVTEVKTESNDDDVPPSLEAQLAAARTFVRLQEQAPTMTVKESLEAQFGPFQSSIVLPFLEYIQIKGESEYLPSIAKIYCEKLYQNQGIEPVRVVTATPMTSEQQDVIVEKMKGITGASDIKISNRIDKSIVGGFEVQFDFLDTDRMLNPRQFVDATMKTKIKESALANGVVIE